MAKVVVTVVGGECQGGHHQIGDRFEIESVTPQGICLGAWGSIFPYVVVLRCDGEFPWEDFKTKTRIHCPDPKGIILEIEKKQDRE